MARLQFQFPSNGKRHSKKANYDEVREEIYCFNSLQTGKGIPSTGGRRGDRFYSESSFNSLQTGKGIPSIRKHNEKIQSVKVSIPFKREKAFQDQPTPQRRILLNQMFQFPSNGKRHSKLLKDIRDVLRSQGFNSLQTGKGIPSQRDAKGCRSHAKFQFPSNGKRHSKYRPLGRY